MINWLKKLLLGIEPEQELEVTKEVHHPKADVVVPTFEMPDFDNMTKLEIDIWAKKELGIRLDRRRTKDFMIEQIQKHLGKEN